MKKKKKSVKFKEISENEWECHFDTGMYPEEAEATMVGTDEISTYIGNISKSIHTDKLVFWPAESYQDGLRYEWLEDIVEFLKVINKK